MAFKPNYRQERLARERTKDVKRNEKQKRREEDAAKRKAEREPDTQSGAS